MASQLAAHGFHAAVTYGNAPSIDILVGLLDGSATLSLQVKTSHWALPTRGRGEKKTPHHYEWDVGQKSAMLQRPDLFFAFVDLKLGSGQLPDVFIIPSEFVYKSFQYAITKYFGGRKDRVKRWRFHPEFTSIEQYKNNYEVLHSYLKAKG